MFPTLSPGQDMLSSVILCIVRRASMWGGRYTRTWVCGVCCAMYACSDMIYYGHLIWHIMLRGYAPILILLCCGTSVGRVATFCLPSPLAGAGFDMTYVSVHTPHVLKIYIWYFVFSVYFLYVLYQLWFCFCNSGFAYSVHISYWPPFPGAAFSCRAGTDDRFADPSA